MSNNLRIDGVSYSVYIIKKEFGTPYDAPSYNAILKVKEIMNNGHKRIVDLNLEKFFDTVNKDLLTSIIRRTVKKDKVISLIKKHLQEGVLVNGVFERQKKEYLNVEIYRQY